MQVRINVWIYTLHIHLNGSYAAKRRGRECLATSHEPTTSHTRSHASAVEPLAPGSGESWTGLVGTEGEHEVAARVACLRGTSHLHLLLCPSHSPLSPRLTTTTISSSSFLSLSSRRSFDRLLPPASSRSSPHISSTPTITRKRLTERERASLGKDAHRRTTPSTTTTTTTCSLVPTPTHTQSWPDPRATCATSSSPSWR